MELHRIKMLRVLTKAPKNRPKNRD